MKLVNGTLGQSVLFEKLSKKAIKQKKAKKFDQDFYDSLTKKYAGKTLGDILLSSQTTGNCYYFSLLLAGAIKGSNLVVGNLDRLDANMNDCYIENFGHGWVEKDGLVFDTTSRQIFDKKWYYQEFGARAINVVSSKDLSDKETFRELGEKAIMHRPLLQNQFEEIMLAFSEHENELEL